MTNEKRLLERAGLTDVDALVARIAHDSVPEALERARTLFGETVAAAEATRA